MSMTHIDPLSAEKLASIATCGMGFEMQVGTRNISGLLMIARAVHAGLSHVVMFGLATWSIEDLQEIGLAGSGQVSAR